MVDPGLIILVVLALLLLGLRRLLLKRRGSVSMQYVTAVVAPVLYLLL